MRAERIRFRTTLQRLEVLTAAVQAGGFRAAADRLGISEAAISRHIQLLEHELGARLFQRRRGRVAGLTAVGATVCREARELLDYANSLASLNRRAPGVARPIQLWVHPQLDSIIAKAVAEYLRPNTGLSIVLRQSTFEEMVDGVQSELCDVGYFLASRPVTEIPSELAWREPLALCAGLGHPVASIKQITPEQLRRHSFVTAPADSHFRRVIDESLADSGLVGYRVGLETTHAIVARESVVGNRTVACLVGRLLDGELLRHGLRCLDLARPLPPLEVRHCVRPALRNDSRVAHLVAFLASHAAPS